MPQPRGSPQSLSVKLEHDGKVLLKCHAGCTYEAILAAAHLESAELSPQAARAGGELWTPRGDALAIYHYTDERGEQLFDVCRLAGKQFLQRRPDPAAPGGYRWKLDDVRRVLYRLPQVLRTAAAGGCVYVCEGEKDVQALEHAGVVATTNPGGAGKWRPEFSEALRGADVIIIADREPGQQHARQVAAALAGIAASCRIVEAAAGKDAADHLAAGRGVAEFVPLGDAPEPPASAGPVQTAAKSSTRHPGSNPSPCPFARWMRRRRPRSRGPSTVSSWPASWPSWRPTAASGRVRLPSPSVARSRVATHSPTTPGSGRIEAPCCSCPRRTVKACC